MANELDALPSLPDPSASGGLMVLGPAPAGLPGEWYGAAQAPPAILTTGIDPIWLLHSLRRRWILATSVGVGALLVGALAVFFIVPATGSSTAYLKVSSVKPHILAPVDAGSDAKFETYRQTLIGLFKTQPVLYAALRKNDIDKLPCLRDEDDKANWIRSHLIVRYPDNAEILMVGLEGERPDDLKLIVQSVTTAFMDEIIEKERKDGLMIKSALERSYEQIKQEILTKTRAYNKLAAELQTRESTDANVEQRLAFTELNVMREEREKLRGAMFTEGVKTTLLKAQRAGALPMPGLASKNMIRDPEIKMLEQQISALDMQIAEERNRSRRPDAPSLARLVERRRTTARQLAERQAELAGQTTDEYGLSPEQSYKAALKESQTRQALYTQRLGELEKAADDITERVKKANERSLELDALKTELDHLRHVGNDMGQKIEAWEVELSSPKRVDIVQEADSTPGLNKIQRAVLVGFGGLVGLGLSCTGVALWDFRKRKLNGAQQVDEGLGLTVMGELPPMLRRGKSPLGTRLSLLTEAVDNVRTLLMHMNHGKPPRVVLVTSADAGEGRSTVAGQLAASLARAGRRTVLVDGDLRQPSLHKLFNFPLEAGLCEILRGQATVDEAVRATEAANLWVITAGRCDVAALQALAQDGAGPPLGDLRRQFDYVVIDGAPVLNLSDSLLLGQHVDGAILSTLRDQSQVPRIHAAGERLKSVGIRVLGSVVNGVPNPPHERTAALLQAAPAV